MTHETFPQNHRPATLGWAGIDIGGANIKVSLGTSADAFSIPFPMWKRFAQLSVTLADLFLKIPAGWGIAVTMTGELADCFENRRQGVEFIVAAVKTAADVRRVFFYNHSDAGEWSNDMEATQHWIDVAAANWHAIARFSARFLAQDSGFLIDIGSTTTDIIPICNGDVVARGKTDFERLQSRELFYCGVQRTPICSLCDSFNVNRQSVAVAREFFATIEDAFIVTGDIAEDSRSRETADGRPSTRAFAAQRLAKMVCSDAVDRNSFDPASDALLLDASINAMANQIVAKATDLIRSAIVAVVDANPDLPKHFVVSGQGEWLSRRILNATFGHDQDSGNPNAIKIVSLAERIGPAESISAAAYSVAVLANEDKNLMDLISAEGQSLL